MNRRAGRLRESAVYRKNPDAADKVSNGSNGGLHLYQCMEYVHVAAAGYRFGQQAYRTDWYQYAEQRRCTVDYPDAGGRGNDYHSIHFHLYRRPEGLIKGMFSGAVKG